MGAAAVLLPTQQQLSALQKQRDELTEKERHLADRLYAHSVLLEDLDRAHPAMIRRLAAAQLNVAPRQWEPILLASETTAQVDQWVETAAPMTVEPAQPPQRQSHLSRIVQGPYRLWIMGGSVLCVFAGLVIGSSHQTNSAVEWRKQPNRRGPATRPVRPVTQAEPAILRPKAVPIEQRFHPSGHALTCAAASRSVEVASGSDDPDPAGSVEDHGDGFRETLFERQDDDAHLPAA